MEFEFDKEIDVLLRQAARRDETVSEIADSHLDADEINAFVEHALSDKARFRAVEHLADCSRCRNILSDLIDFNAESASEIIPEAETKTISGPWYKPLFVFPQIAYTMGVLVMIFGGMIAFTVLKNSTQNNSAEVAKMDEKSKIESLSKSAASNAMSSNSSMNSGVYANSNAPTALPTGSANKNIPSGVLTNSNAAILQDKNVEPMKPAPKSAQPFDDKTESAAEKKKTDTVAAVPPAIAKENNYSVDGTTSDAVSAKQQAELSQNSPTQNRVLNQTAVTPDTRNVQNLPMSGRNAQRSVNKNRAEMRAGNVASDAKDEDKAVETRSLGGKNFRRADGVWYDVKYKGQQTANVSRSSNDYKKLDGGLRSIADNLGGVVVIVWKDKAYRIQ